MSLHFRLGPLTVLSTLRYIVRPAIQRGINTSIGLHVAILWHCQVNACVESVVWTCDTAGGLRRIADCYQNSRHQPPLKMASYKSHLMRGFWCRHTWRWHTRKSHRVAELVCLLIFSNCCRTIIVYISLSRYTSGKDYAYIHTCTCQSGGLKSGEFWDYSSITDRLGTIYPKVGLSVNSISILKVCISTPAYQTAIGSDDAHRSTLICSI